MSPTFLFGIMSSCFCTGKQMGKWIQQGQPGTTIDELMDFTFPTFWYALHEQILRQVFDFLYTNGMVYCATIAVVLL
jgi:hypothetical protein